MDYFLFQQINNLAGQWPWLNFLEIFFAQYLAYILVALVFLVFWRRWKAVLQIFLAAALAKQGIVEFIRWFWPKTRPFVENNVNLLIDKVNQPAFPSGHAAFFFALSAVVYSYNKKTGLIFFTGSFLIAISRVFVGVHWPSDVIAGAIVGVFSGWLIVKIFKKF